MHSIFRALGHGLAGLTLLSTCLAAETPGKEKEYGESPARLTKLTELSLEDLASIKVELVYGASKYAQKPTEAPSSISVLTQDDFKRYGYRTLADALQSLQGFHVSNDRNYSYLGARGINLGDFNSRSLLLIDGHRVNNNLTDGAYLGSEFLLDVDLIDHVEIVRGPGSVLYGNNAFFGVINVVTRKGNQVDGAEVSGTYGSFDTYKSRVTIGKSFYRGVEFLLSGSYYESAGQDKLFFREFNTPAQNYGIARNMDGDTHPKVFGSLSYRDFSVQAGFDRREKVNPTAQSFTTFNDPRLRTEEDRGYGEFKFAHQFPEILDVSARLYYDQNDFKTAYPIGTPKAVAFFDEEQHGQWWGAELQLTKRLWEKHVFIAGAEYRDDFAQEKRVFDQNKTYTDLQTNRQSHGVFAQGDFACLTNLHLIAGARYDQYGDYDATYNPRVAVIYNPFHKSTFKFIYGTAFRSPNFLESSDTRFGDIQPEEITSYELIYEQGIGSHLRSSIAGYYNQMDNLIVFENLSFANIDAEARGLEMALEGDWEIGLRGRASYTIQQTENCTAHTGFADSPEHLLKFNLSVPIVKEKLFASLEYQYNSSRHTVFSSTSGATVAGADVEGYGVLNFTLFSRNLLKNLEISGSVYNLLDQTYADPSSRYHVQDQLPRDGRSFRLKLTYRF